jgi:hypothetical protein
MMALGATGFNPTVTFNSDSGSNYTTHYISGSGTSVTAGSLTSQTSTLMPGIISTASIAGVSLMDILDYSSTNKYKTTRILGGKDANGSGTIEFFSGLWMNTSALNSIIIAGGTFNQYSSFALYGVK